MSIEKRELTFKKLYDKECTKVYKFIVIKSTENDIIQKLNEQENKAGYIKRLIRKDIAEEKNKKYFIKKAIANIKTANKP